MCWSWNFGFSGNKKRKTSPSSEKKRRDSPTNDVLHGEGKPVVADVSEKRRSKDSTRKRRSGETVSSRSSRPDREEHHPRSQRYHEDSYQRREHHRPALNVQVPEMYYRSIIPDGSNSSQETLLNPRPHRSQQARRRHPKRTSQTTLRGRGAKRDPPRHSKSQKNLRHEPSRGWSFFAPTPPRTPKRSHRTYQQLDSPPRSHQSSRQRHSPPQTTISPDTIPSPPRQHRSRPHDRSTTSSRQARSRTPNTAARRVPDRRFAVLAATNQALEDVRREAFAHTSPPPPRRERLRRYEGVTIPTSTIPFNWDCVSSSQASAPYTQTASSYGYNYAESSNRRRRSRR